MSVKAWLQVGAAAIAVLFAASVVVEWRAERREWTQLQDKLKTAQEALTEASARQATRDTALQQQVAQLEKTKATLQKPVDVVKALPEVLPLPKPLVLEAPAVTGTVGGQGEVVSPAPNVALPVEDLKPLYDTAVACKECQAQLAAAQADLKDEKAKTSVLGRERDDALRMAKGGSMLRRVARAAKWFVIGAAAGAAAAKLAR
jgi:hypothetical protein